MTALDRLIAAASDAALKLNAAGCLHQNMEWCAAANRLLEAAIEAADAPAVEPVDGLYCESRR